MKVMRAMGKICYRIPFLPLSDGSSADIVLLGKSPFGEDFRISSLIAGVVRARLLRMILMSALFGVATYRAYVYLDVVDSFVADPQFAFQSKAMFNLFRTEVRSDQPLDFCPFLQRDALAIEAAPFAFVTKRLRLFRTPTALTFVAAQLP